MKGHKEAFGVDGDVHFLKLGEVFKLNTMNICTSILSLKKKKLGKESLRGREEVHQLVKDKTRTTLWVQGWPPHPRFSSPGRWGHKQADILGLLPKLGSDLPPVSWGGRGSKVAEPVSVSTQDSPGAGGARGCPVSDPALYPVSQAALAFFNHSVAFSFCVLAEAGVGRERAMVSVT